jgi:hypothetical protein
MSTIDQLEHERDEALKELRLARSTAKKSSSATLRKDQGVHVEEELFDISRMEDSPRKSPFRNASSKRHSISNKTAKTTTENDARVLSSAVADVALQDHDQNIGAKVSRSASEKRMSKRATVQDTEDSILQDPTAASNISRRRRQHDLDENMTSAYIIPDITLAMKQQQQQKEQPAAPKSTISKQAQVVLHDHDPQHVDDCAVCQRLTSKKQVQIQKSTTSHARSDHVVNNDYTAQITALMKDIALEEPTFRPKISPDQALAHLKKLLADQYYDAKRKHGDAWEEYDDIEAPRNSKRHAAVGERMSYWARKMEECRVNLDQLRDVEEGMRSGSEL